VPLITKRQLYQLLKQGDFDNVLSAFDEDAELVRRLLTRASYDRDDEAHGQVVGAFRYLSERRAQQRPEFFREIIRRHLWAMNEESGNIDWSAPEIIVAVIVGAPGLFSEFASYMFEAAAPEPVFHPSLMAALEMLALVNPIQAGSMRRRLHRGAKHHKSR